MTTEQQKPTLKAMLVMVSLMTRVIVPTDTSDADTIEAARSRFIDQIKTDLHENIETVEEDTENPYDPEYEDETGRSTVYDTVPEEHEFINYYRCPKCGEEWNETWTATCDSECPTCDTRNISPYLSDDSDITE